MYNKNLSSEISIDYLAFTVPRTDLNMAVIRSTFDATEIEELSHGGMGYRNSAIISGSGRMYWHPDKVELGIHVRLGARALGLVDMTALGLINRVLDWSAKITRIDIAFDDHDGMLNIDQMHAKILAGEVQTPFRRVTRISGANAGNQEKTGDTVNVGSRKSRSFCRIYDKRLEMVAKGKEPAEIGHWVRVELELKKDKAAAFSALLAETARVQGGPTTGELCRGLLLGLLDFKDENPNDMNKSRWPTSDFWLSFVQQQGKLKLSLPKNSATLEDSKQWIEKYVSVTLAMIVLSHNEENGDSGYDFIVKCIVGGQERLKKELYRRMDEHEQEMKERQGRLPIPE
jgi:phage replication initiation protein